MFTLSADGGICAECRPAESLLRQRQAGGQMQEESCWWLCSCDHGGGCGAHQAARALLLVIRERRRQEEQTANDEDCPQLAQEMGPCSQDHTYPSGTRECDSATVAPI